MIKLHLLAASIAISFGAVAVGSEPRGAANMDWHLWESVPVQNDGRVKPLDTLATETLLTMSQQSAVVDSETNRSLNPTALYLTLLFEWSGWDHPRKEQLLSVSDVATEYSFYHQADHWDKTPLLSVEHSSLKQILGLPEHVEFVAPTTLATLSLIDPHTQKSVPFAAWGRKLQDRKDAHEVLSDAEMKGLELAQRLRAFEEVRMGRVGGILTGNDSANSWFSLAAVLVTKFDDGNDPRGSYRQAQQKLWLVRAAFLKGDAHAFNQSSREYREIADSICTAAPTLPSKFRLGVEVAYNHWQPFHLPEFVLMLGTLASLIAARSTRSLACWIAYILCAVAACALVIGIAIRTVIAGRLPVATMYETVITVATGIVLIGVLGEARRRRGFMLAATASISLVALLAADHCSNFLDYQIRPLEPVLRSPIWLVAHVFASTMSYAAFAIAMGTANIMLAHYAMRSCRPELTHTLSQIANRSIQVGIVLLSFGMFFGSLWADFAWGRLWAWDPKETWTLITILCYIAVLRTWHGGHLTERGFAAASVLCFSLVIMTWYGINLMLRTGLHSYGFSSGGGLLVCMALFLQIAYVIGAVVRSENERQLEIVGQTASNAG